MTFLRAYGTSEGVKKGWLKRPRGRPLLRGEFRSSLLRRGWQSRPGSELVTLILEDDAAGVATELDMNTVTDRMMRQAQREIYERTQASMADWPDTFTVWRGGAVRGKFVPVTTQKSTAIGFSQRYNDNILLEFKIRKADVAANINLFQWNFEEGELLVPREKLK